MSLELETQYYVEVERLNRTEIEGLHVSNDEDALKEFEQWKKENGASYSCAKFKKNTTIVVTTLMAVEDKRVGRKQ